MSNRHQASFSSLATGGTDVGSPGCLLIWINLSFELRYVCQFPESLILVVWKWSLDTHKITVFRCQMIAYVNDISPNHHRNTLCLYKKVWIEEGPRKEMLPCTRLRSPFFFLLVNEELPELKLVTQKILINLNSLLEICVVIFEYSFVFVAEKIILCWVENEVFFRLFVPTSFFVLSKNVLLLALQNQRKLVNSLSPGACPSLIEWLINF